MVFAGRTAHGIQVSPRFYVNRCARFLCIALMAACASAGSVIWPGVAHAGTNAPSLRAVVTWPASPVGAQASAPVPLPSNVQPGDILLAQITNQGPATQAMTAPNGWSLIPVSKNPFTVASGSSYLTTFYYYKIATSSDAGSTATWSWGTRWLSSAIVADYSGVSASNPFDGLAVTGNLGRTATNSGVTTSTSNDAMTSWVGSTAGSSFSLTQGSGHQEASETYQDRSGEWDASQAAAGATGPYSWRMPSSSVQWVTAVIALRSVPPQQAPVITSASAATFTVGEAGSFRVTATGSPAPSLSESGALPSGVTFNSSTGVLSGTPASGTSGTYNLTFTASNGVSPDATQSFTLTLAANTLR